MRLSSFRPSSWSLADALGCRGVSQACHTLWTHCGPFDASLKGRWTSPWPLEVRFKGKSGGVCGVRLSSFQPSYWSLNDALGCRGVFEARSTLWSHRRPFGASLGGRWASPRPLEVRFQGKSGGIYGVSFCRFSALSLVSGRCPGFPLCVTRLPDSVDTLWYRFLRLWRDV